MIKPNNIPSHDVRGKEVVDSVFPRFHMQCALKRFHFCSVKPRDYRDDIVDLHAF